MYFRPNLSTDQAVGTGPAIDASTRIETIHELSSGVIGSGESGASRIGSVGDVQP